MLKAARYYRAYFTADFVWHMALTAEMARFEMPPRNPYMADRGLNYYWTYFLVPADAERGRSGPGPRRRSGAQGQRDCHAALLLAASFYCFAATAARRRTAAALGVDPRRARIERRGLCGRP